MKFAYLLTILLSWSLYTNERHSLKRSTSHIRSERTWVDPRKKERRQQIKRKRPKYRPKPKYRTPRPKYVESRPKSHRHLDQRSLRRMYRNG